MRRPWVWTLAIVAVLVFGLGWWNRMGMQSPAPGPQRVRYNQPAPQDRVDRSLTVQADQVAEEVPGVKRSYVVVANGMAYVGLISDSGQNGGSDLEQMVRQRIQQRVPELKQVLVTVEPDTVQRIRQIGDGIAQGRPSINFTRQIQELNTRMQQKSVSPR